MIQDLNINEILNIYFLEIDNSNKYDNLFFNKLKPIFKFNLINFLDDFIYQISIDKYFYTYNQYFTNIMYDNLNQEKYKAFAITSLIKYYSLATADSLRDLYKPLLQQEINNLTYDIYKIAYNTVYDYFYEYLKQYIYLNSYRKDIYDKLIKLVQLLLDDISLKEEDLLIRYFRTYENAKYLLIQSYGKDSNNLNGYTVLQSYDMLKDAIQYLNQRVEFEFKLNPGEVIYYNNFIYNKNKLNIGLILSEQNFDRLIE